MMHCGYEPTIVRTMNAGNLLRMTGWNLPSEYGRAGAARAAGLGSRPPLGESP